MSNQDTTSQRTCTRCNTVVMTFSEIVYSQGKKVCLECKKETKKSDEWAFDAYMNSRD